MMWLIFQGENCFSFETACFAFDPSSIPLLIDRLNGVDVFLLRFQIVWPLIYFFIPLMIFDKYPEQKEESKDLVAGSARTSEPSSFFTEKSREQEEGMALLMEREPEQGYQEERNGKVVSKKKVWHC